MPQADFQPFMPLTQANIEALEARGLDTENLATRFGIGASNRLKGNAIAIPYTSNDMRVGTKHRTVGDEKRFSQDIGSRQIFWNVDALRDQTIADQPIIITEGEMDALAALQAGYSRVVSVPGGAPSQTLGHTEHSQKYAFVDDAMHLFKDCREIILATDDDAPGLALRQDLVIRYGHSRCKWLTYPKECKDLGDALRRYGVRGVRATIERAQWFEIDALKEWRQIEKPPHVDSMDCGMVSLGQHYRLRVGDVCVVTGPPSHGKTAFVNEVCCRMAEVHGWKTLFASFEQRPKPDHARVLRSFHSRKRELHMTTDETDLADEWIQSHFYFIVPKIEDDVTLPWLLDKAKAAVIQKGARIIVIDPWNEMDHHRQDMSETDYVGYALRDIRNFARLYQCHIIIVAHPQKMQRGKDGKYPKPSLWDISGSAHFANKADVGIVVFRPKVADGEPAEIEIVKSRYHDTIGRPGMITGIFNRETSRYTITEPEAD